MEQIIKKSAHTLGLYCLKPSMLAKKQELEHIKTVEIPAVTKEIADAREKGDLSENAEYQYGKDKKNLLMHKAGELAQAINKTRVVPLESVDPDVSGFGTVVYLQNTKTGEKVTYTMLGPWESNAEKNVINIMAPIGRAIVNHRKGDTFDFVWNDTTTSYKVLDVKLYEEK